MNWGDVGCEDLDRYLKFMPFFSFYVFFFITWQSLCNFSNFGRSEKCYCCIQVHPIKVNVIFLVAKI